MGDGHDNRLTCRGAFTGSMVRWRVAITLPATHVGRSPQVTQRFFDPTGDVILSYSRAQTLSRIAGCTVALIALLALMGWVLDIRILTSGVPGWRTMKGNTALRAAPRWCVPGPCVTAAFTLGARCLA